MDVEFRSTSIRVTHRAVSRTTTITGIEPLSALYHLVDTDGSEYSAPASGGALSAGLARILGVGLGDTIEIELLEHGGETRPLVVARLYDPMIGQGIYMTRAALNTLLREQDAAPGAYLSIAPGREASVMARLKDFPEVAGATSRAATIHNIDEQMRESMVFVLTLIITSACVIAACS
jgi:putative ABC transport system permease protein